MQKNARSSIVYSKMTSHSTRLSELRSKKHMNLAKNRNVDQYNSFTEKLIFLLTHQTSTARNRKF